MDIIERLSKIEAAASQGQPVDLAISLLSCNNDAIVNHAAIAEG
jgi:hypothetical protein